MLSRFAKAQEPLKTTETLLCIRDDFQVYNIVRTVTISNQGQGGFIDHSFSKVDPEKIGLSGTFVGQLVKRIIEKRD